MADFTSSGSPGCILCQLATLLFGDPHLYGFEGERFELHGEQNKYYNLLSDTYVQINAFFSSWNNDAVSTIVKKIGIKVGTPKNFNYMVMENDGLITYNGERLDKKVIFNLNYQGYLGVVSPKTTFEGFDPKIPDIQYAGTFQNILLQVRLPAYEFQVIKASEPLSDGSTGNFLNFMGHIMNTDVRPHGIIGQTADFDGKARVATGNQGEGIIEGVYSDYEVSGLMSDDFKFNKFGR